MNRRTFVASLLAGTAEWPESLFAQGTPATLELTREDMEKFLRTAEIESVRTLSEGTTNSQRAKLSDGCLTHDSHVQTIDEHKIEFRTMRGVYLNFSDTYKHNIAAYLLDKMLELRMTPVSVERKVRGDTAAVTWWVDDVMMSEKDRYQKEIEPPDQGHWNKQIYCVRVFDELIYNIDRNLGNLLITKDWTVWMIDHTRAFRPDRGLRNVKNLERCDSKLLTALRGLTHASLKSELGYYLGQMQLDSLLRRRDRIVEVFEKALEKKRKVFVLFEYLPRPPIIELTIDGSAGKAPCREAASSAAV